MLDILRSTPETKNTKIIMMTALSQAEDKARAEKLGADRYLVKSQVTLEDVTREARAMLDSLESQAAAAVAKVENTEPAIPVPTPAPASPQPTPAQPTTAPVPEPSPVPAPIKSSVTTIPVVAPDDDDPADDTKPADGNDDKAKVDKKLEKVAEDLSIPVKKEEAEVKEQVDEFIASNPTLTDDPEPKESEDTRASDAVNSLTKPIENKPDSQGSTNNDRGYVATGSDDKKPSSSLEHTKTIEPTPEAERDKGKTNLNELLAKEDSNEQIAPAVNSIISPNDTGGAPPASN